MGGGAHLVGHSYGGLGALFAAARRLEATLSLALLEPAALALGQDDPAGRALVDEVRRIWDQDLPDDEMGRRLPQGRRQRSRRVPA
jgi:pimeloyl-ACP methyl ester carboxylesterase